MRRGERLTGTRPSSFAGFHQLCPLQGQQEPPDNDRVCVDAAGQKGGRDSIALFVCEDGQHVNGHGKTATGSHRLQIIVTAVLTVVNR